MTFYLGKPLLIILAVIVVVGAAILIAAIEAFRDTPNADLNLSATTATLIQIAVAGIGGSVLMLCAYAYSTI